LYIVASQGASPSGRLTAVLGRSDSEERPGGCCSGETLLELEGTRGLWVFEVRRVPAGVVFRVALGGLDAEVIAAALVPGFAIFAEDDGDGDFMPERLALAAIGIPLLDSISSSRFWLPTLFPLVLDLGLSKVSSPSMLPLKARFLGIGVSRSNLSDGIGTGLEVKIGILDPVFRTDGKR
jgi:hypothetical protein